MNSNGYMKETATVTTAVTATVTVTVTTAVIGTLIVWTLDRGWAQHLITIEHEDMKKIRYE